MALDKDVAKFWCQELAENLAEFRKRPRLKKDAKLDFISKQYSSLFVLVRVNRGDAIMKGVPFQKFAENCPPAEGSDQITT